jgi:hypothetical protein
LAASEVPERREPGLIYIKSVLAGLTAVLAGFAIVLLAVVVFNVFLVSGTGSGGIGAVSIGISERAVLVVPLSFAADSTAVPQGLTTTLVT